MKIFPKINLWKADITRRIKKPQLLRKKREGRILRTFRHAENKTGKKSKACNNT